jgi:cell division protein FtsQ
VIVWDNPRLANAAANALYALAFALSMYAGARVLFESPVFSLKTIIVGGELQHVAHGEIVSALQGRVRGTFFTVNLETVRVLFEGIPWVRRAELRRAWPDRLEVRIEEHVALARWGQRREPQLVNTHGELFRGQSDATLPVLSGPTSTEGEVTQRYLAFRGLLAPLALEPRQVLLSSRLAWQLRLSNGLIVKLGRDSDKDRVDSRLARLVSVYPQTFGEARHRPDYVDLRYPNGFATRAPEPVTRESRKAARKRV